MDYHAMQTTSLAVIHLRGRRFVTPFHPSPFFLCFFLSKGSNSFVAQGKPKAWPSLVRHRCRSNMLFLFLKDRATIICDRVPHSSIKTFRNKISLVVAAPTEASDPLQRLQYI